MHAHPDDETLTCGATMARAAAEGVAVTLVTCTLGEHGEVVAGTGLEHLGDDTGAAHDALGAHRAGELRAATAALGVRDVRLLGASLDAATGGAGGRWRDSGMAGTAPTNDPRAFCRADPLEAADLLVAVLREVRPQVVVTYDPGGGYGHPDHVQAHRVTTSALALAAAPTHRGDLGPPWAVAKAYWVARPASLPPDHVTAGVPDELVTTVVDGSAHLAAKEAALRAHRTQVGVGDGTWALTHGRAVPLRGVEHFRLAAGRLAPDADGLEPDLFAGLPASGDAQ